MSVKIVAHRGESLIAPENTLEAFTLAWARGAQCIEGDFHLTADGVVVCMHDDNALRTCGVERSLAKMTLAEIKELDAGRYMGEAWRFTRVPTLAEVLDTMPDYGEIFIELKSAGAIIEAIRSTFLQSSCRPEQLTFIAFDEETISETKRRLPAHNAYWLTCNWTGNWNAPGDPILNPDQLVHKIKALGVDGVDIARANFLDERFTGAFHAAGLSFNVWTVNEPEMAGRLAAANVDSITTDCARVIRTELGLQERRRNQIVDCLQLA